MIVEVKVPQLSESVAEATLLDWRKKEGEPVKRDENLIDIETDKVVLELPAPADGVLTRIIKKNRDSVSSGEVIAQIDTEAKASAAPSQAQEKKPAPEKAKTPPPVMEMRKKYQERFEKEHGTRLGFMSFFVKAAVHALKRYPVVNASIDGTDIVYHGYFDIGVAVGSPRGLVVPILRDTDRMSFAEIEKKIGDFGKRAQDGKLAIEELPGGTFSISNGGVFAPVLATPVINPPQSAILGVHATKDRAVVEAGQVVVRPMNYLALSYDHRIIDGREAVLFLVSIKEALEDPARLILEI